MRTNSKARLLFKKSNISSVYNIFDEKMRIIKYYDRINRKHLDLEVTDEVAKFLLANDKWLRRKQNEFNFRTISLDTVIYSGEDDEITLKETIADDEEEIMNCKTCGKRLEFYNLVWKVVGYLDKSKYDLIWNIFVEKKTQKQIASELNITEGAVSQLKDTAISDLVYHFNCDEEFRKTSYYTEYLQKEMKDAMRIVKELTVEDIFTSSLSKIHELTSTLSQVFKKSTILNKEIDKKDKLSSANRIVKHTVEELNPDNDTSKVLNVPKEIFTEENTQKITQTLLKFFK